MQTRCQVVPASFSSVTTQEALDLLEVISMHLERLQSTVRPELPKQSDESINVEELNPLAFAHAYYGLGQARLDNRPARRLTHPWVTAFEDVASLSTACAQYILTDSSSTAARVFEHVLSLHAVLVRSTGLRKGASSTLLWDPHNWLCSMRKVLCYPVSRVFRNFFPVSFG